MLCKEDHHGLVARIGLPPATEGARPAHRADTAPADGRRCLLRLHHHPRRPSRTRVRRRAAAPDFGGRALALGQAIGRLASASTSPAAAIAGRQRRQRPEHPRKCQIVVRRRPKTLAAGRVRPCPPAARPSSSRPELWDDTPGGATRLVEPVRKGVRAGLPSRAGTAKPVSHAKRTERFGAPAHLRAAHPHDARDDRGPGDRSVAVVQCGARLVDERQRSGEPRDQSSGATSVSIAPPNASRVRLSRWAPRGGSPLGPTRSVWSADP